MSDAVAWSSGHAAAFWTANMSSLYLVLAFIAGMAVAPSPRAGRAAAAVAGAVVPVVALVVFYGVVVHEHHVALVPAEHAVSRYGLGALVLGPVFGMAGVVWVRTRAVWSLGGLGAVMLLEPVAWRVHLGFQPQPVWPWMVEAALGATLGLTAWLMGRSSRAKAP